MNIVIDKRNILLPRKYFMIHSKRTIYTKEPRYSTGVRHELRNLDIFKKSLLHNKIDILFFERFEKEL